MNYLEWVEFMRKDFRDTDKELERVIEAIKKSESETSRKFRKNSRYGNL